LAFVLFWPVLHTGVHGLAFVLVWPDLQAAGVVVAVEFEAANAASAPAAPTIKKTMSGRICRGRRFRT
jgi:hypothetical protein